MLKKSDGLLYGFKWIADDETVLLAAGDIDDPMYRNDPSVVRTSVTLNENQRLAGIKSASRDWNLARHWSF